MVENKPHQGIPDSGHNDNGAPEATNATAIRDQLANSPPHGDVKSGSLCVSSYTGVPVPVAYPGELVNVSPETGSELQGRVMGSTQSPQEDDRAKDSNGHQVSKHHRTPYSDSNQHSGTDYSQTGMPLRIRSSSSTSPGHNLHPHQDRKQGVTQAARPEVQLPDRTRASRGGPGWNRSHQGNRAMFGGDGAGDSPSPPGSPSRASSSRPSQEPPASGSPPSSPTRAFRISASVSTRHWDSSRNWWFSPKSSSSRDPAAISIYSGRLCPARRDRLHHWY
jgi:hypothetical protein